MIPEMQRQVVGNHGWLTAREFLDGYTLAQLTPGPTMLVVAFVGYRVHGLLGAGLATLAMFLPTSALAMLVTAQWQRLRTHPWAIAAERALAPVGIGLSTAGVFTLARSALVDPTTLALALGAAVVIWRGWAPAMLVVVAGGLAGWVLA